MLKLGDIAKRLNLELLGEPELQIAGIAPLTTAAATELSFVAKKTNLAQAQASKAGALILRSEWAEDWSGAALLSDNPYLSFAQVSHLFDDRPNVPAGVHESAVVHETAVLGAGVSVGPHAVIEQGVVIGEGTTIGAGVYIGHHTQVGSQTRLYPNTVLYHRVAIGDHCIIHSNTTIGADGFGFAPSADGWTKIVQRGGVRIGDRVEIGAGTTIDRGALEDTLIADNVILDNQVHIGHNVKVGERTAFAACSGVGGSTVIGTGCTFAGMVGIGDHLTIADNVHVNGQGRVSKSLEEPGLYASGTPIQAYRDWSKNAVRFEQLAKIARRITAMEKQLSHMNQVEGEGS